LAAISELRPLARDGGGPGLRAALVGPKGEEEDEKGESPVGFCSEGARPGDVVEVSCEGGLDVCAEDPASMMGCVGMDSLEGW
jgi:hypothetical protein